MILNRLRPKGINGGRSSARQWDTFRGGIQCFFGAQCTKFRLVGINIDLKRNLKFSLVDQGPPPPNDSRDSALQLIWKAHLDPASSARSVRSSLPPSLVCNWNGR